ncbi:MAG: peptidoglycan glycosyltransferase [Lachnospiraceae bacterium]|nr:peptidoglycan glycosyltransferase [Lachnospiraceae bacterium]
MKKRKRPDIRRFSLRMRSSLGMVYLFVIIMFLSLIGRMLYINYADGKRYEKRVLAQQSYVNSEIPYKRGTIYDRNMNVLAISEKVYNLILDASVINADKKYYEPTRDALSVCFGMTEEEFHDVLKENEKSRYIKMDNYKELTFDMVDKFKTMQEKEDNIKGVWFEATYKRKYPQNQVASKVVGFTGKADTNAGTWGIEEQYNDKLSGVNGREYGYFDSDLNLQRTVKSAQNGNNIVSTIDCSVQKIVEEEVAKFRSKPGAENVAVMMMNPNNGEIIAMHSNETFDLNNPRDLSEFYSEKELKKMSSDEMGQVLSSIWRNYCISDAYEPGSTFKPFTVAAALEEGVVNTKSTFYCDGGEKFKDGASQKLIKCVNTSGHGYITLDESLMESCNDAMMQIVKKLKKDQFFRYEQIFGIGKKTGIDLPGETSGTVFSYDNLKVTELATASFGQGNTVTMTQMLAGFSSIVNGGYYYTPHVVKEVRNESGAVIETIDDSLVKKTISAKTSTTMRKFLLDTVEEGTASPAGVKGYSIGGKTGTAEKHPRSAKNYLVSFIGCAPADNPEVVIYVVIDHPHVEEQAHSTYATEMAHRILKKTFPYLGIYKDKSTKKEDANKDTTQKDDGAQDSATQESND